MSYYTRPFHDSDVINAIDICFAAFLDDEGFKTTWPRARQHPHIFRAMWARVVKFKLNTRGVQPWITVRRHPDGREEPAALAFWRRTGPDSDPTARAWRANNNGWSSFVERTLADLEERYLAWTQAEAPAADMRIARLWEDMCVECAARWEEKYPQRWHLAVIAVHPDHQRKGLGGKLVSWGIQRAEAERVPATLFASVEGHALYKRLGFRAVDRARQEGGMAFDPFMVFQPTELLPGLQRVEQMEDVQTYWAEEVAKDGL